MNADFSLPVLMAWSHGLISLRHPIFVNRTILKFSSFLGRKDILQGRVTIFLLAFGQKHLFHTFCHAQILPHLVYPSSFPTDQLDTFFPLFPTSNHCLMCSVVDSESPCVQIFNWLPCEWGGESNRLLREHTAVVLSVSGRDRAGSGFPVNWRKSDVVRNTSSLSCFYEGGGAVSTTGMVIFQMHICV